MNLLCVEPIRVPDQPTVDDPLCRPYYVSCDFCHETACEDIWAGHVAEEDWRLFYEVVGECGLIVCERCLPRLEEES